MNEELTWLKEFENWLYHDSGLSPKDQIKVRRKCKERIDSLVYDHSAAKV